MVKGLVKEGEDDATAARREFEEETGWVVPEAEWVALGETILKSRKTVVAWALKSDFDIGTFEPGTFTMYGREYPEVDRVVWMEPAEARDRLNPAQAVFIDRLERYLRLDGDRSES